MRQVFLRFWMHISPIQRGIRMETVSISALNLQIHIVVYNTMWIQAESAFTPPGFRIPLQITA